MDVDKGLFLATIKKSLHGIYVISITDNFDPI